MAASDYDIVIGGLAAYICSKKSLMNKRTPYDRRFISESEILMLVDWLLDREAKGDSCGFSFKSRIRPGSRIELRFVSENNDKANE